MTSKLQQHRHNNCNQATINCSQATYQIINHDVK